MANHVHTRHPMRLATILVLTASGVFAADEAQLALSLRAQSDFDRVQLAPEPQLADTYTCIQSQAALLPVASRVELPLVRFHKGFCTLIGATITHKAADYTAAATEFDAAVNAWPLRVEKPPKGVPIEPVSSSLPVLAAIARLNAGPDQAGLDAAAKAIESAAAKPDCPASVMPTSQCQGILQIGRQWLGWIALRGNHLPEAAREFSGEGWPEWVAGREAFEQRNYAKAAEDYHRAIQTWEKLAAERPALSLRLGPAPDLGLALADLGGAQLLTGDTTAAIATMDAAIKRHPDHAWNFFLRARAKELSGQTDAALADYNMASRAAFAGAKDLVSGEAHLYRGVVLYRRKDYARAEDEFISALNFDIPAALRPDAVAWRRLAAVAGGACGASREQLQHALPSASPYFPAHEAQSLISACPSAAGALQ